jgi:hypothetical protein
MMENRSFDHMLGGLKAQDPRIDGLTGTESNPDTAGNAAPVKAQAAYQGQLDPDPGHQFPDVDLQLFNGNMAPDRVAATPPHLPTDRRRRTLQPSTELPKGHPRRAPIQRSPDVTRRLASFPPGPEIRLLVD